MLIDDAISLLKQRKKAGVKSIILSHWEADQFGMKDDLVWAGISEAAADSDWSWINDSVTEIVEEAMENENVEGRGE